MSKNFEFGLRGLTCISCVQSLESALRACNKLKIEDLSIDVEHMFITLKDDDGKSIQELQGIIRKEVEDIGFECFEITSISTKTNQLEQTSESPQENKLNSKNKKSAFKSHLIKGLIGTIIGFGLMAFTMSGLEIPIMLMYALTIASSALTLYLGKESYYEAVKKFIKSKTLTMDTLFAISATTVIGVSIASFFLPWLPMMMEAGLMIFGFRHIGKAIEDSIKHKMASALSFKERGAKYVEKEMFTDKHCHRMKCAANSVVANDIIYVKGGDVIPVDGVCDEHSSIYDTIVSGSTLPHSIKKNDRILAGMKVPDDVKFIKIRVTQPQKDSYLARLDHELLKANNDKSPIEKITNKILQYFIPAVLGLSIGTGIAVGVIFNPILAIQCAATLLVSACPCTLGFITPLAIKIGMSKAMENGVHFKSGKALQAAQSIDTVLFDLNGTLTTGVPKVKNYRIFSDKISSNDFFIYLGLLEQQSQHPIAKSICAWVNEKKLGKSNFSISDIDKTNHCGIKAVIDHQSILVGNKNFLMSQGVDVSDLNDEVQDNQQIIYLAKAGRLMGYITLVDPLRTDAKFTVNELKKMGKDVYICTGADLETAKQYARSLGIAANKVFADCVGTSDGENDHSKTRIIEKLQAQGKHVAMVGDAANDAVAITKSDFGIAVKSQSGDEMSQKQAGAVIENASLLPVVTTFALAKETVNSIKQNLSLSFGYNATMLLLSAGTLFAGFALTPGIGVALMVMETSLLLLNQYRIKNKELSHLKKCDTYNEQLQSKMTYSYLKQSGLQTLNRSSSNPSFYEDKKFLSNKPSRSFSSPLMSSANTEYIDMKTRLISNTLKNNFDRSCRSYYSQPGPK